MANSKSERLKPMIITDPAEGREYTLEFNRRTIAKTEQAGLDVQKIESAPMAMIPLLFWGAFLWHHPQMTREQTDKILFEELGGLGEKELAYLGELYAEPFKTLVASEEEGITNPRKMTVKF